MKLKKFPVVKDDLFLFNGRKISDLVSRGVVKIQGKLDQDVFAKALNLLLTRYPILTAKFKVNGLFRPTWKIEDQIGLNQVYDFIEVSSEKEQTRMVNECLLEEGCVLNSIGFVIKLIRAESDVVVLRISHIIVDGGGMKELLADLAMYYTKLLTNPGLKVQLCEGERSLKQVYNSFSTVERLKILGHSIKVIFSRIKPYGNWEMPLRAGSNSNRQVMTIKFNQHKTAVIKEYCKRTKVSINDVMVASYIRALYKLIQPKPGTPLRVLSTVNLRRYLPNFRGANLCNLSSTLYISIGKDLGNSLPETIAKVNRSTGWQKSGYLGLNSHQESALNVKILPFPLVQMLFFIQGIFGFFVDGLKFLPIFTNAGDIKSDELIFGSSRCEDVFIMAPIAYYPAFFVTLVGFNNTLTLSTGFCEEHISVAVVQELFNYMELELDALFESEKSPKNLMTAVV